MRKILITGAGGFSALYLRTLLSRNEDCRIILTDLHNGISDINCIPCDLSIYGDTRQLLHNVCPDQLYHLAGSFTNQFETDFNSNVLSSKNICDSLLSLGIKACRVLLVGSAAEYGNASQSDVPISETFPLRPVTVYGLTKALQTQLMNYYCDAHGMDIVMARPFNLFGKGISNKLFIGSVYAQIEKYKRGEIKKIVVGGLTAKRDYMDIKEAVGCYQTIMTLGEAGQVYNVGTGKPIEMAHLLERILGEEALDPGVIEERPYSSSTVMVSYADVRQLESLMTL